VGKGLCNSGENLKLSGRVWGRKPTCPASAMPMEGLPPQRDPVIQWTVDEQRETKGELCPREQRLEVAPPGDQKGPRVTSRQKISGPVNETRTTQTQQKKGSSKDDKAARRLKQKVNTTSRVGRTPLDRKEGSNRGPAAAEESQRVEAVRAKC